MKTLIISLFAAGSAMLRAADNPPAANPGAPAPAATNASAASKPDPNDPVEQHYRKLLEDDDAAQDEVDRWVREADAFAANGAPLSKATLQARIRQRFDKVKQEYENFLFAHPNHARAHLAYGSFLNDELDEEGAVREWEKARQIDPNNPAAWNNLANYYGHRGPIAKAFQYYEHALQLRPNEPVYFENLATAVYVFRKDAEKYYHLTERQVFDKALALYQKAMALDPKNFTLASDYAQTYYGIKPLRVRDALQAWNDTLRLATNDVEREGVYVHLARIEALSGQMDAAQRHLDQVTNSVYAVLKDRLERNLLKKSTNAPAPNPPPAPANPAPNK